MSEIFENVTFKSGLVAKNRIVKASMEENMAQANQTPGDALFNLYTQWSSGGAGILLTGNVMVDRLAMTGPGGMALVDDTELASFSQLARSAKSGGAKVIMQINHPGRQVYARMKGKQLAPSAIPLDLGKHSKLFSTPTPMTDAQIEDVIARFAQTALLAQRAGFDGVQVHAAHGYLLAQFLSPLTNQRTDKWGGSLEARARLLLEIIGAIKAVCASSFSISVKLNSADFQRGGFDVGDAHQVVKMLEQLDIDFIELSGGNYEAPAMQGRTGDERTLQREAYFLSFAKEIAKSAGVPIMTTGGIRRLAVAKQVIDNGVSLVGMASALAYTPDLPARWLAKDDIVGVIPSVAWKDKTLGSLAVMALIKRQMRRLGKNKTANVSDSPLFTLLLDQFRQARLNRRYLKHVVYGDKHSV